MGPSVVRLIACFSPAFPQVTSPGTGTSLPLSQASSSLSTTGSCLSVACAFLPGTLFPPALLFVKLASPQLRAPSWLELVFRLPVRSRTFPGVTTKHKHSWQTRFWFANAAESAKTREIPECRQSFAILGSTSEERVPSLGHPHREGPFFSYPFMWSTHRDVSPAKTLAGGQISRQMDSVQPDIFMHRWCSRLG